MKKLTLFTTFPAMLLGIVMGVFSTPTFAVDNNGLFELDWDDLYHANALDDGGVVGEDWSTIYDLTDSALRTTGIVSDIFVPTNTDKIFTGGGSKDELDIDQWLWKEAKPTPDKDNITNGFAAAYLDGNDDLIIYFGADRYANNGAADMGFWFFQNDITIDDPEASGGGFVNLHEPGDILVLANFTRGGDVSSVFVYEWVLSGGDTSDHLTLLGQYAECDGNGALACALSNSNEADDVNEAPWDFDPKFGDSGFFPKNSLFEGGINVTQLFNGNTPCFASFMAETRSSPSTDAVLKDFVLEKFELCGMEALKSCEAALNSTGDEVVVTYRGTVTNTGALPLDVSIKDSEAGSLITAVCYDLGGETAICDAISIDPEPDNLVFLGDGSATFTLYADETVLYEGNYVFEGQMLTLGFTDIITAIAKVGGQEVARATPGAYCEPEVDPEISVTKACTAQAIANGTVMEVTVTGGGENTGNVKLVDVTLTDLVDSAVESALVIKKGVTTVTNGDFDLLHGETFTFEAIVTEGDTSHADTIKAEGTNAFDSEEKVSDTASASCNLTALPGISVTKECKPALNINDEVAGKIVIQIDFSGEICNESAILGLNNVALSDNMAGAVTLSKTTLTPSECINYTGSYFPAATFSGGAPPNTAWFWDEVTATGVGTLGTGGVEATADDDCTLCE